MTDENYPRDLDDDVDPADLAFVQSELSGLSFLRPLDSPADDAQMPPWVWDRLTAALTAEAAAPASLAPVPLTSTARPARRSRWGGGLVAASVAVVAVGLGVTMLRGGATDVAVVAGDAPVTSVAAEAKALSGAAAPASALEDALVPEDLQAPREFSFASFVPPVRKLIDSDMNYTSADLGSQVRSVLSKNGMGSADEAESMMAAPAPASIEATAVPASGFTEDAQALRDCITELTDAASTALMVDRSTFDGQDAGVVVAPEGDATAPTSAPGLPELQVWVVDADCDIQMSIRIQLTP